MRKKLVYLVILLAAFGSLASLTACEKEKTPGDRVEEAVKDAAKKLEDAADDIGDAVDETAEKAEQAAKEAKEKLKGHGGSGP